MPITISVALCTYNGGKYLSQQLDSILEQTLPVNEIIVCDDQSTDRTLEILDRFQQKYPAIFKIFRNNPPLKTVKNFGKAISLCSGDWIFLADQDDIWEKEKVEIIMDYVASNPKTLLLFSDAHLIDEIGNHLEGSLWSKWGFTDEQQNYWSKNKNAFENLIENRNFVTGATVAFSKKLKNAVLPIEIPPHYYHDCFLAAHAAGNNGLRFLNKKLIKYRIHPEQQVGISKSGKNTESVLTPTGITREDYIKKMYEKYPNQKESRIEQYYLKVVRKLMK